VHECHCSAHRCVQCPLMSAVLCCAVLCCAVLCCAVLCCAVLCCAVCCAVLCCAVLCGGADLQVVLYSLTKSAVIRATTRDAVPCREDTIVSGEPIVLGESPTEVCRCFFLPQWPRSHRRVQCDRDVDALPPPCAEAATTEVGHLTRSVWVRAVAYDAVTGVASEMRAFEYRLRSPLAQWWTTLPDYLRQYEDLLKSHGFDTIDKVPCVTAVRCCTSILNAPSPPSRIECSWLCRAGHERSFCTKWRTPLRSDRHCCAWASTPSSIAAS
jgi:hypothetical protein